MPCPQCGQPVTIGAPLCPTCGLRFNPQMDRGRPSGNAAQPARGPAFDDGMPGWLRQIQSGPGGQTPPPPGPQQYQPPSPYQPSSAQIPGNSLMSGDAMPAWLREAGANPPAANAYGQAAAPLPPNYPSRMPQPPTQWPQQSAPDPRDPRQQRLPSPGAAIASNALFDEASLPEWLRQSAGQGGDRPTIQQTPGYNPPSHMPFNGASPYGPPEQSGYPQQPTAQSAFPSLDQAVASPRSLPSPSMYSAPQGDVGGLPGWLSGGVQPPESGQRGAPGGMAAQSLIDETALPTWLRSQPQPPQNRQGQLAAPANPPSVAWDVPQAPFAPQWNQPAGYASPAPPPQQVGGGTFVDDGVLPGWLRQQGGGQPAPEAAFGAVYPPQQNGAYRPSNSESVEPAPAQFSASDLIDPQALPGWVQHSGDPQASFSSSTGWSVQQPTGRQPRADAVDRAARGATGRQPAYEPYDEPVVPSNRVEVSPRDRGRPTGAHPAPNSQIPQEQLPPWLQGGPPAGAAGGTRRPSAYEDDPRRGQQVRPNDEYAQEWDEANYGELPYEEPYTEDVDPRQQGYAAPYDDPYGYDPRADPRQGQGYADGYDSPPPPRASRERRYGVGSEEAYGDPNYDSVGTPWQPPQDEKRGGNAKRGGWHKFFGRR